MTTKISASDKIRNEELLKISQNLIDNYTIKELADWIGWFQKTVIEIAQGGGHE